MNRLICHMIKYMNGSIIPKTRYMNGVGFEILARTPVSQLPPSYPPPTPPPPPHTPMHPEPFLACIRFSQPFINFVYKVILTCRDQIRSHDMFSIYFLFHFFCSVCLNSAKLTLLESTFKQIFLYLSLVFGFLIIHWSGYHDVYNEKLGLNSWFVKQSRIRIRVFITPSNLKMANEIKRSLLRGSPRD